MSKEETVQWIMTHLFGGSDCHNPKVHDLFYQMDENELAEFVKVAELFDADLLLEGDLDAINMILEKYDQEPKLDGFCSGDEYPEEGEGMVWLN